MRVAGVVLVEKNGFVQMQVRTPDNLKGYFVNASCRRENEAAVSQLIQTAKEYAAKYQVELESYL